MAWRQNSQGSQQPLAVVPAAAITRAQRSGKTSAIHAPELVVEPAGVDFGGDLVEGGTGTLFRADCTKQIGRLRALVVARS
jgi:hypothetical protein